MNKVIVESAMKKMGSLKFDPLMTSIYELEDDYDSVGATDAIIDKIYALNFMIILAAQGRGITFEEYTRLMLEFNYFL